MTDVLRSNYEVLIPQIIGRIQKCTFIAIDAEFTGLLTSQAQHVTSLFDFPADRYMKLRATVPKFMIPQFGISIYEKDWDGNFYHADTYNIYLFPVSFDEFRHRDTIECQISSLNFLSTNNFDYNKFIREGVPYLRESDAILLRKYLKENPCFMRSMEIRDKEYFPSYNPCITNDEEVEEIVNRLRGFSKVIAAIQKSEKPLIGHNMLMDLMLLFQQFHEELPEDYEEFKEKTHELFPIIFDTKNLAARIKRNMSAECTANIKDIQSLHDTNLFVLYHKTHGVRDMYMPYLIPRNGSTNYRKDLDSGLEENLDKDHRNHSNHCHEAGFDACITGAVFIRLAYINARHSIRNSSVRSGLSLTTGETFSAVRKWENEVNLPRAVVTNINFNGPDLVTTRPDWIRVDSNPSRKAVLNVPMLRSQLAKFGDSEVEVINSRTVILACGGWGCARNIWTFLEEQGFILSTQQFPSSSKIRTNYIRWGAVLGMTASVGILFWSFKTR